MTFPVAKVIGSISVSLVFKSVENLILALAEMKKAYRNLHTNDFRCRKEEFVFSQELECRFSQFTNQLKLAGVKLENSLDTAANIEIMLEEVNRKILECNSQEELAILLQTQALFILKAEKSFENLEHLEFTADKMLEEYLQED